MGSRPRSFLGQALSEIAVRKAEVVVSTENGNPIAKVGVYLFQGCEWGRGAHIAIFILPLSELPEFFRVPFQHPSGR